MLCKSTINALESICGETIPDHILNIGNGIHEAENRRVSSIATKWGEFDGSTALIIADQLYRHQQCIQTLATLLTDKGENYGKQVSRILIAASQRHKNRRPGESIEGKNSRERKTRETSVVRLYRELDTINANGADILFSAIDRVRILIPDSVGERHHSRECDRRVTVNGIDCDLRPSYGRWWQRFTAYDTFTQETVELAAKMDERELSVLERIVSHNDGKRPHQAQPVMFTVHHSDGVSELLGIENVGVVRRCFRSLANGLTNCVLSAYAAAVHRFLVLEFGNNTENRKEIDLSLTWETDPKFETLVNEESARKFANTLKSENERVVFWLIQNEKGTEHLDSFYHDHSHFLGMGRTKFYETLGSLVEKAKKFGSN